MPEERTVDTLGDALPREMTRVRTEIMPVYYAKLATAPGEQFMIDVMNDSLDRAQTALAQGDLIAILRAYHDLKGYQL